MTDLKHRTVKIRALEIRVTIKDLHTDCDGGRYLCKFNDRADSPQWMQTDGRGDTIQAAIRNFVADCYDRERSGL